MPRALNSEQKMRYFSQSPSRGLPYWKFLYLCALDPVLQAIRLKNSLKFIKFIVYSVVNLSHLLVTLLNSLYKIVVLFYQIRVYLH